MLYYVNASAVEVAEGGHGAAEEGRAWGKRRRKGGIVKGGATMNLGMCVKILAF